MCVRNGFAEISRVAIQTTSIFEHSTNKAQLTKHTVFPLTWCRDVRLGKMPDRQRIMHELDERIGVAVSYMRLEPTERRLVVEPEGDIENTITASNVNHILKVKVLNAKFGILDFDTAIVSWDLISFLFINGRVWWCLMD